MTSSSPDEEHGRTVKRGAFPVRRSDVEQAGAFVPEPADADPTTVEPAPESAAARRSSDEADRS